MDDTQLAWVSLALVPGVGPKAFQKILASDLCPSQLYKLDESQLLALGVSKKSAQHMCKHPFNNPSKDVESALHWHQQKNHHLLTFNHPDYPDRLKEIATPPPLLMVKGRIESLALPQLAIVGSRYPSASGQSQAFEFAQQLTEAGLLITSGLARGIDGFAHQGALQAGGQTLAVLGTGLNEIYPKQNQRLAQQIAENGAVISEFPLRAKAIPGHFPRRNRIVSGLSLGTLVIEATLKSGSLITARQALEQNREVFAIPGAISNPQKAGCHYLIRQGASLIEMPEQIIDELSLISERGPTTAVQIENNDELLEKLDPEQFKLLRVVDYDGINLDDLVSKTELSVAQISALLMDLELTGLIRQEQGLYSRI